jgi:hypothetical protein
MARAAYTSQLIRIPRRQEIDPSGLGERCFLTSGSKGVFPHDDWLIKCQVLYHCVMAATIHDSTVLCRYKYVAKLQHYIINN